jgi:hypothetical protein
MGARIEQELRLLRSRWPELQYDPGGRWVLLPGYPLPAGWNRPVTDLVFQIQVNHPGAAAYGFLTPNGLFYNGNVPTNYQYPAPTQPPFPGPWGLFSWSPEDWQPHADIAAGSNLFTWAQSFTRRFMEGA